ncbi:uncharacterized protein LOC124313728 [Daphnia pulicaria]|uniref:uncharacterized protein LOC124313207 n=1 Tax=Daphnia pulicaria TaxID=35523 RepID=UPI001EECC5F1|nr:uncharacterized protein LOC124313207 [Daphnia pulicaria]XP_046634495.1 uncharacterized protein LOC124313728 [Daphnia pulicaria]
MNLLSLSDVVLISVLLGNCCQPLLGGGVKVTLLNRRVKPGNKLELNCRVDPGEKAGLPVVLPRRWISNGAVVELDHNRLPPGAEKTLTITNRFQDIGFTFIASVVSRIRWTAVPKKASGIYQCRDSNDVSQSTSNATLIVANSSQHDDGRFHGRIQDQEKKIHIFQSGSTFNLTCLTSVGQVEWLGPQSVEDDEYYYREKEIPLRFRWSKKTKFKGSISILIVQNASYLDTGYYTCYNNNNFNVIDRQFVYVEDPQHLILPPVMQPVGQHRNLRVIGYYSESDVQVGCGPTHPSVRVILKKLDNEIKAIASSEQPDGLNNDWSFNPFEGFKINMVYSWEMMH